MNLKCFQVAKAAIILGAGLALAGCSQEAGYSDSAPPTGGPEQNSHVPPGEAAKTPSSGGPAPALPGGH